MKKLPVIPYIRDALYYTYANIGLIFKVALVWLGIYAIFTLVFSLFGIEEYLDLTKKVAFATEFPSEALEMGYGSLESLKIKLEAITLELGPLVQVHDILDKLLRLVAYAAVGVAMIKAFMQDEESPRINFGGAELKFFMHIILFLAVSGGVGLLMANFIISPQAGSTVSGIFYVAIGLILLFLVARFLLVFPAIAIGDNALNIKAAWQVTRGNGWNMYWGVLMIILSSLPVAVFKVTVSKIALPIAIIWPVQLFMSMIMLTFILTFLSICYQFLILKKDHETQGPLY